MAWGVPRGKVDSLKSMIFWSAFVAVIYLSWGERNNHIFKGSRKDLQAARRDVEAEIRSAMTFWRGFPNAVENQRIVAEWGVPIVCLKH